MEYPGSGTPRQKKQYYVVVGTILFVSALVYYHSIFEQQFSMKLMLSSRADILSSTIGVRIRTSDQQDDEMAAAVRREANMVSALGSGLILDQSMLSKQKLLVPNPKSLLVLHTSAWSVRSATMIAHWGSTMLQRDSFLHVVYHGSNMTEIEELRFAGMASYSAVHMFDSTHLSNFLESLPESKNFMASVCGNDGDCSPETKFQRYFKYLTEVALLGVRLEQHPTSLKYVWVFEDNVQYIGDIAEFLDKSESIEADVLVAKSLSGLATDERVENGKVVTTYGGIRRISGPMIQNTMKRVVSELVILSDDIAYSSACVQDPMCTMKWLDVEVPDAFDSNLFEQFESTPELPFLKCLHGYLGDRFTSCREQARMNVTMSSSICDGMYGKFISRKTNFKLEESILFDFQFVRKCGLMPVKTYKIPTPKEIIVKPGKNPSKEIASVRQQRTNLQLSDDVEVPEQLRHVLKSPREVYQGRKGSWWVEMYHRSEKGFSEWDGEMIAKQFRVHPKPKVIYIVRTHKVDERVMINLSRQAMSLARYGGHMHIMYQGMSTKVFHLLRTTFSGYLVAVHWFDGSSLESTLRVNDSLWNMAVEACLVKHDLQGRHLKNCIRTQRHWVEHGGPFKVAPTRVLWLYAFLPEVFFFANFGPIPQGAAYWSTEYDVSFTGDISKMFETARLSADDDLVVPGEDARQGWYGPLTSDSYQWQWWVNVGPWAKQEEAYRSLASTKRLSGRFIARVIEAIMVDGWLAVDELFFGTLCNVTPGCKVRIMNGNFHFHMLRHYESWKLWWKGDYGGTRLDSNPLSQRGKKNLVLHKIVIPFSVCENSNLQFSFVARNVIIDSDWCKV